MAVRRIPLGPANLAEGELRSYKVGKRAVLIARVNGAYKALDDWCNHAGCSLSQGRLDKNVVVCPCHEMRFDLDTGENLTSPRICDDQRAYQAEVEAGVLVVIGEVPEQ